ncbi:hypothetical protein [Streptomyces sp. NBC_01244]|uniref:hypothetical protein n=1 Tax=Streptomyces sp. NBC_01244 TaxID=2903797 RepID=UPI002E145FD6|nr:hypothetical protein OG247_02555 [Streptomyces sp. NBC_01244]
MAVLSTILVILGAWCAASVVTAALYAALRRLHVRRQRVTAALPDAARAARCAGPGVRTGRPGLPGQSAHSGPSGRSGHADGSGHAARSGHADGSGHADRPRRPAHPSGRSGWGRRVPPPDLQAG